MIIELDRAAIGEGVGAPLPPVSAVAAPARPGVLAVETEQAPTLASLVAGGRMRPDSGRVLLDGHRNAEELRRRTALVDTPGIAEPFPVLTVRRIVREELALAGQRSGRGPVDLVLREFGLERWADVAVQRIPTEARVRMLAELALLRPGVEAIVVTSPERHGGDVAAWFSVLRELAERGVVVVLVTSLAAAEAVESLLDTVRIPEEGTQ